MAKSAREVCVLWLARVIEFTYAMKYVSRETKGEHQRPCRLAVGSPALYCCEQQPLVRTKPGVPVQVSLDHSRTLGVHVEPAQLVSSVSPVGLEVICTEHLAVWLGWCKQTFA